MTRQESIKDLDPKSQEAIEFVRVINNRICEAYLSRIAATGETVHPLFAQLKHAWTIYADCLIAWSALNSLLTIRETLDETRVAALLETKSRLEPVLLLAENFFGFADGLAAVSGEGSNVSQFTRLLETDLTLLQSEFKDVLKDLDQLYETSAEGEDARTESARAKEVPTTDPELAEFKDYFDDSSLRILAKAFTTSRERGQYYVAIVHIIYALSSDASDEFQEFLSELGIDHKKVRDAIEGRLKRSLSLDGPETKIDRDASDLLKRAVERAKSFGRAKVEVADLLKVIAEIGLFYIYARGDFEPQPSELAANVQEAPRRLAFRGFALLLVSVCVLLMSQCSASIWLRHRFNMINRSARAKLLIPRPTNPPIDALIDVGHSFAEDHDFRFSGGKPSNTILYLRKKDFRAHDSIATTDYPAVECFLKQLEFEGRRDDEFATLEAWGSRSQFDKPLNYPAQRRFLGYVETVYTSPLLDSLDQALFAKAKWLSSEAARRAKLLDMQSSPDEYARERMNEILLYEALFWEPKLVYANVPQIRLLYETTQGNFQSPQREKINQLTVTGPISFFRQYWLGVYDFREGKFASAQEKFTSAALIPDNPKLHELSMLMQARCIFWSQRSLLKIESFGPSRAAINNNARLSMGELREIAADLTTPAYKAAVERYVVELEDLNR
jgi:Clp amino terminal domain, pathogenicity island component